MNTPTPQDVLSWEARRSQAMRDGDVAALEQLLSPRLVYVHSSGGTDSRDSYLQSLRSGALRYVSAELKDLAVQLHPGAAIVTGRMEADILKQGQPVQVRSAFMTVWLPGDGGWTLHAHQGTPVR